MRLPSRRMFRRVLARPLFNFAKYTRSAASPRQGPIAQILPAALACCLTIVSGTAAAADTAVDQRYQEALDAVLGDVADPAKSFRFVQVATEIGDLRGAAAALERMLLLNPRLANIQLELGIIYLRLGNAELGRYHINEALRAPNVPVAVRARAEQFLAVAAAATRRHFFQGRFSLGLRYDDNANSGTDELTVVVGNPFGPPVETDLVDAGGVSDTSLEAALSLSHSYAFAGRPGSFWDTNFTGFTNRYNDLSDLDFLSLRLDTGPLFSFGPSLDTPWQFRPFVTGGKAWLDGEDYIDNWGGGVELRKISASRAVTALRVQYLDQTFEDLPPSAQQPTRVLTDRSGDYTSADLLRSWQRGRTQYSAGLVGELADTEVDHRSYDRYGALLGARIFFGQASAKPPWSLSGSVSWRRTEYDGPDPVIFPDDTRRDTRVDVRVGVEVPVTRQAAMTLTAFYTDNDSNLTLYTYDNTGVVGGFYVRF